MLLSICLVIQAGAGSAGADSDYSEADLKAAYLFNFARYIEWPDRVFEDDKAQITVCVFSSESFYKVIKKTIGNRSLDGRMVGARNSQSLEELGNCNIIFIGKEHISQHEELIAAAADQSIFTVSDAEDFAERGGCSNFFQAGKKIHFSINVVAVKRSKLKVSSQLLRIAQIVD